MPKSLSLGVANLVAAVAMVTAWPVQARVQTPAASAQQVTKDQLTKEQRRSALQRAAVWAATDVASMNLRAGPQGPGAFEPMATVTCDYVNKKPSGATPKFLCALGPDDADREVKVKYGKDNPEIYAEVAATRLLWALGFGADRMYPVRVVCRGCPADPDHDATHPLPEATFDFAVIERKMPGKTLETKADEGWSWPELDLAANADSSLRAQRDALKLLAVMIQHTDNKSQQQRLLCLPDTSAASAGGGRECGAPFMMISDLGLTFGRANMFNRSQQSGANFDRWTAVEVWRDSKKCVGHLSGSATGTLSEPVISEAGRKFLADLLAKLSDAQLRDMFEVARFDQRSTVSIDDWVTAFKHKRDEIAGTTCPR